MTFQACPECHGARLNPASRAVTIAGLSISALCALTDSKACRFCMGLRFQGQQELIAHRILKETVERLGFLVNVGLDYLTLDRVASTLSGGESATYSIGHTDRLAGRCFVHSR